MLSSRFRTVRTRRAAPLPVDGAGPSISPRLPPVNPRPLVVRFGSMGDMVMLTALTRQLADRFGQPCDVVASKGSPQLIFRELDSVGDVYTIQSRRRLYLLSAEQRELVRQLRRRGSSRTVILDELPKVHWLMRKAGIPDEMIVRTGPGSRLSPRGDLEHLIDFGRRLGDACVAGPREPLVDRIWRPELNLSTAERDDCRSWIRDRGLAGRPLVLFQTLSRRVRRGRWPAEHWRRLVDAIQSRLPDVAVVLTGSPEEAPLVDRLCSQIDREVVCSAASELPLRRLFALFERAHSCVSIDTGPAHAAAALRCPLVVLFGRADPRRNRAFGDAPVRICTAWPEERWPETRLEWESSHQMEEIPPERVISAWLDVERSRRSRSVRARREQSV